MIFQRAVETEISMEVVYFCLCQRNCRVSDLMFPDCDIGAIETGAFVGNCWQVHDNIKYCEFMIFASSLDFNQYVNLPTAHANLHCLLCNTPNIICNETFCVRHSQGKVYLFNKANYAAVTARLAFSSHI